MICLQKLSSAVKHSFLFAFHHFQKILRLAQVWLIHRLYYLVNPPTTTQRNQIQSVNPKLFMRCVIFCHSFINFSRFIERVFDISNVLSFLTIKSNYMQSILYWCLNTLVSEEAKKHSESIRCHDKLYERCVSI